MQLSAKALSASHCQVASRSSFNVETKAGGQIAWVPLHECQRAKRRANWIFSPQRVWLRRALFEVHLWVGAALSVYAMRLASPVVGWPFAMRWNARCGPGLPHRIFAANNHRESWPASSFSPKTSSRPIRCAFQRALQRACRTSKSTRPISGRSESSARSPLAGSTKTDCRRHGQPMPDRVRLEGTRTLA